MESHLNQRIDELEAGTGSSTEGARVLDEMDKLKEALEKERSAALNKSSSRVTSRSAGLPGRTRS